jgi:hypothetical protein
MYGFHNEDFHKICKCSMALGLRPIANYAQIIHAAWQLQVKIHLHTLVKYGITVPVSCSQWLHAMIKYN